MGNRKHIKVLGKYVCYLLFDYISHTARAQMSLALTVKLLPGVYALLGVCSKFEYVLRVCVCVCGGRERERERESNVIFYFRELYV